MLALIITYAKFSKSIIDCERHGVSAKRSRVKENDSNDTNFSLKLIKKDYR